MKFFHRRVYALIFISVLVASQTACPKSPTTREVKSKLDSAANYLLASAKLNRELHSSGVTTIETRRLVATRINQVNGYLKLAVERAGKLKPCDPGQTDCGIEFNLVKADVLALLNRALTELQGLKSGNEKLDATLALAVPLIQQALVLVNAVKEIT